MDALFVVPALVSNNVNEKIVPALAKLVERNIAINNYGMFQDAAIKSISTSRVKRMLNPIIGLENQIISNDSNTFILTENMISEDIIYNILNEAKKPPRPSAADVATKYDRARIEAEKYAQENIKRAMDRGLTAEQQMIAYERGYNEYMKNSKDQIAAELQVMINQSTPDVDARERAKYNMDMILKNISVQTGGEDIILKKQQQILNRKAMTKSEVDTDLGKLAIELSKEELETGRPLMRDKTRRELEKIKLDMDLTKFQTRKIEDELLTNAIERDKKLADIRKTKIETDILKKRNRQTGKVFSADLSYDPKVTTTGIDQLELPRNVTFFNMISLEPTIIEIPLKIGTPGGSDFIQNEKLVRIGIKCVPYRISSAVSLIKLLKMSKLLTDVSFTSYMARYFNLIIRKIWQSVPFTKTRDIYKGGQINPDRATDAIIYSPNSKELNSKFLAKNFKNPGSSPWSTMIMLSSFDFKNEPELLDVIKNYRQMTKYVIGDIVITNETKETAYFCGVKLGNCQEFSFEYLKKLLNLSNIIDASATTRHRASAFAFMKGGKSKSFNSAVMESSVDPIKYINDIF